MALLLALLVTSEVLRKEQTCTSILIDIENDGLEYFLSEQDILDMITQKGKEDIVGGKLIHISLKEIELRIKRDKFVDKVEVTKDLKGNLIVYVSQSRPIARVFRSDSSFYLSDKGTVLPLSNRYTARVMLVTGTGTDRIFLKDRVKTRRDSMFFAFVQHVNQDPFLKAQVSEVEYSPYHEVTITPQVFSHQVEIGECEQLVDKFKKLNVFYKRILPVKGWNYYKKVNLRYKDQIICS